MTLHRFAAAESSYLLAFLKDLRASNRMRERITELEKSSLMGNLVRSITHEINNPLTAILGHAELIQLEEAPASVRDSAQAILEAGRRCKRVIESMLGQFQRSSPCLRPLRLSDLLRSVAKQMDFHLRYHLVGITFDLDDSIMVSADAQQLEQVLVNLMCNAVYAMQERPTRVLGLRSTVADERAAVEVSDTGTGIPPDVLKHLFEPGFTTKPSGVGHGLGLMICQEMVQRHGGTLSVASQEGQGTVFTLHLPRIVVEAEAAPADDALRPAAAEDPR